jgi:hypothetical protein
MAETHVFGQDMSGLARVFVQLTASSQVFWLKTWLRACKIYRDMS